MNWKILNNISQLQEIVEESNKKPVLIFKHSTRCSVSMMAKRSFQSDYTESLNFTPYYLDLISFRDISNKIADDFGVFHQSPQVLLIENGKCIYNASHGEISIDSIPTSVNS
ncbi:MAG: bacillithiol system protein YtxJ [Sphingobacteriales bacterium]|jgi:bacillithiol system protein YtxJ